MLSLFIHPDWLESGKFRARGGAPGCHTCFMQHRSLPRGCAPRPGAGRGSPRAVGRGHRLPPGGSHGGNWRSIRAGANWSNQGLRYYAGQTWYRQTAEASADYEGQTIHFWAGSVEHSAEVWDTGEYTGANHGGDKFNHEAKGPVFEPFELDATEALRPGGENVITRRVVRHRTREAGAGGIMGPAMFYVPAE